MSGPVDRDLRRRTAPASAARVLALALAMTLGTAPVWGYDAATTHAGLTERAVVASGLHHALIHRLARPLGLFEPIALHAENIPLVERTALEGRLGTLDPAAGCRPGPDGVASALSWVIAGAVIAETPAERGQHLFYDPSRGAGLTDRGGISQIGHELRQLADEGGGGMRALATGTNFNMTGLPSTQWLASPQNDVGLVAFYDELEASIASEDPGRRSTGLARALLALGGTLAVLQNAGEPAHVRNDFRGSYLGGGGSSLFDRGSLFEQYVADTYGQMGVPAAAPPVSRPNVMAFITAADGQGLADRTQRRFFSDGTIPEDAIVDRDTSAADVMRDARLSLPYAYPRLPRLSLVPMGKREYVYALDAPPAHKPSVEKAGARPLGRRLLGYERVPGRVRFFLDRSIYADTARVLLPEIGAYSAGLIDHLLRVEIHLDVKEGAASVAVSGGQGAIHGGQVRLFAEDAAGRRKAFAAVTPAGDAVSVAIPAGTRRIGAVLRAQDDAGELVAVAETPVH